MQLLAKLKKNSVHAVQSHPKFSKIYKGGSERHIDFFKTLLKVASYPAYQNSIIRQKFYRTIFEMEALKAEIKGVFSRS